MKPKIRALRGFPLQAKAPDGTEHQMMGLADARQISDRVVVALPAFQVVLPLMDGTRDIDQIAQQVGKGLTRQILESFIAQLDHAGLVEGPTFQGILKQVRADFDSQEVLPPGSTAAFCEALVQQPVGESAEGSPAPAIELPPEGPARDALFASKLREVFDRMIDVALKDSADPALTTLPKAIVAPHLDYQRGGITYAAVYGRLRVADRPDRVIILGTNHFGQSTGVCGCDKGYSTALGTCEVDKDLLGMMRAKLGDKLFENRFDHEREHSVELQVPWIQHVFGKDAGGNYPKVFGALVHDPVLKNGESYDGNGVALQPFVDALSESLAKLPGRTLIVCSADMSHVGPAFGDPKALIMEGEGADEAQQARDQVFSHDQEMIGLVIANKPSELIATMAWMQNPTRWCSIGNLVAGLMLTKPTDVKMLHYGPVMDQQGLGLVTCAAMAMA